MTEVGIMQGRLSPPVDGRIQAFPAEAWRDELPRAAAAGLDCIEWIYEHPGEERNPLAADAGVDEVRRRAEAAGVAVRSICADYYMAVPLTPAHLAWLVERAARLGARWIVLPHVDSSSLRAGPERERALELALREALPAAEAAGVELHLETDLPPGPFAALLERIDHPLVRANFDSGNSASLGYDPGEELAALAPWLGSVHVKDRVRGGGTVPLGAGAVDFARVFAGLARAGYDRPYVLQVARGEAGDEVALAARNRAFVEARLAELERVG